MYMDQLVPRGYLYLTIEEEVKAEKVFDQFIEKFRELEKYYDREVAIGQRHISMAMIYANREQKEEAYRYLEDLMDMKTSMIAADIHHLEINSMFDNLRDEKRFQKILRKMHSKYMAEHERVRIYLKETGKL